MSTPNQPTEGIVKAMITSVWSSYGHRFIGADEYEQCLTCGAVYELVETPEGISDGAYVAANGDAPRDCTHDTSMTHGEDGDAQDCNCLLCA